jgi:FeS assembly SUF system protein
VSEEYRNPASLVSLPVVSNSAQPPEPAQPDAIAEAVAPASGDAPAASAQDPTRFVEQKLIEGKVIEALQKVYDPEIPVNIYELGLIYGIDVKPDNTVHVKMTLTAPACPVAGTLPGEVEKRIEEIPEVKSATVELVWEPPWSRDMMSEAALLTLGMI